MKEIKKQNSEKPVKKYTLEEMKDVILKTVKPVGDLEMALRQLGDEIIPKLLSEDEKQRKEVEEKHSEKVIEILVALESESHVALMGTFKQMYRGLAKELSSQTVKDYRCDTAAEKALAELIAGAFIRVIDTSTRFNNALNSIKHAESEATGHMTMLSKQIDRATRQFLSSLMTLRQLKTPPIEMKIQANTAFVAQNQQFNNKDETIGSK